MLHCSWDMVHDGCNWFSFWAIFCPFTPLIAQKINIKKKKKKLKNCLEISSFHKRVPKIMIRWWMVPEIWCMTDIYNCYFSFWAIFFPFTPNSWKKQNFEKIKKRPGDIIILHMCTKIYDQMMFGCSWDIVRDGCNYFLFWAILCPFIP